MANTEVTKEWTINEGVLCLNTGGEFIVPSAEQIYRAVFDGKPSELISAKDVGILAAKLEFSKYPCDLKIVLQSRNESPLHLEIIASDNAGNSTPVPSSSTLDHLVISGTWYPFTPGMTEEIFNTLKKSGIAQPGRITLGQYLSLLKNSADEIINRTETDKLLFSDSSSDETPAGINATLYPYQVSGWQWLRFMRREKIGGILADEMGLGKTLQIISLLSSGPRNEVFPSLIVSPTTLLENWRREIVKFAPGITPVIHQGPHRTGFPSEIKKYDVIITSYDTAVRDSSLFNQINWQIVVCDEAQAIKNPSTKRTQSIKRIPKETGFAVTGTPIENKLTDLWSIMDFSVPGFLGSQQAFESQFEASPTGPAELETIVSPLILRRKVADVAKDLPPKIIIPQIIELSDEEVNQYEQIRQQTIKEFSSNASLVVLTRLRMFCTHPFLISKTANADPSQFSNKYSRLVEIVEEIFANSAKVLVFTSYNLMNDMIVTDLGKRFGIYANSIDGRTEATERQNIVDEFSAIKGAAVLVLNPIAAGAGLNITAANHVIHYNLEWNPAKEDQASARAHRRGQDRPVTIHRLFYANTVEEAINDRLERKRELAGTAIVGTQGEENDYPDILNAIQKSPKDGK